MAFVDPESLPFYLRPLINLDRVYMARLSRGLGEDEMAEHLGISKVNYHLKEDSGSVIKAGLLEQIARITSYPVSFFYQPGRAIPLMSASFKRSKIALAVRRQIYARANILRLEVQQLTIALGLKSPGFPLSNTSIDTTPYGWVTALRHRWSLLPEPVGNLTALVEAEGIPVILFPFGTDAEVSYLTTTDDQYPIILINSDAGGASQRCALAYEFSHVIQHWFLPGKSDQNKEAMLFAYELLIPELNLRKKLSAEIALPFLKDTSEYFGVTVSFLLDYLQSLKLLKPAERKRLLNAYVEAAIPETRPKEQPALFKKWLTKLQEKEHLDLPGLAEFLHLSLDDLLKQVGLKGY